MTAMIRYELKKIFQSKLFIALFVLALIGMIAFTAHSVNQYQSGVRGQYRLSIPQSKKIPETFVSDATIGILRDKLAAFEENDNIYEDYGIWKANTANSIIPRTIYHGKYEGTQSPTYTPPVIKDEYLPEYFKLFCPVDEYDHKKTDAAQERESAKGYDTTQKMYRVYTAYAEQTEKELKEGFTVGYDYGWENFFSSLSADTGILLAAVVIFGLCGVFTGEYASAADSLLLSSRRGRARLAGAKIVASLLYAALCWAVYIAMTITVNFAFLGTQGAHVGGAENNIERLPQVSLTILLGTVLLALITLAVSAAFSKQIPSTAAAMLLGLLPLVGNILSDDDSWTQIIEAFPVNMIFGSYIGGIRYVFLTDMLFDLRLLFFPVAVVTVAVCLPLIYTQYCRHQVKN